jgi:hypothetical protein
MKRHYFVLVRLSAALSLALVCAPSGLGQGGGTIEGTVFAAPGRNLLKALVLACYVENNACSQSKSRVVPVQGAGSSANFQVLDLEPAPYMLLAWRDLNGSFEADAGDELAVYAKNGKLQLVTPPASRLELRLQDFNDDIDALLRQGQTSSSSLPSTTSASSNSEAPALVGVWGTTRSSFVDFVNPNGGVISGGGSAIRYEFKPGGSYSFQGILETNGPVLFLKNVIYDEGTYTVAGDVLSLRYRHRERSYNSGKLQTDTTTNETAFYRWGIRPASSGDGTLALYLVDKTGALLEYPRQ